MPDLARYRGYAVLTLVYAALFGGYLLVERRPQPESITIVRPTPAPTYTLAPIQVYVAGAVKAPGVYALAPGSRVQAAVEAAGGLSAEAHAEGINLAAPLTDGQQVAVPRQGETPSADFLALRTLPSAEASALVNINTATAAELEQLPGIGSVYAARIVDYRDTHGPFAAPEDLMQVAGIGSGRFEAIAPLITVR
ncbi:MAG: helix-hairpin-helix domain-containing protein [Anaerolineae bacterium]